MTSVSFRPAGRRAALDRLRQTGTVLIKRAVLDQIAEGHLDLVFRRWKKPTVKGGGTLRTAVGMLDVVSVERVAKSTISSADVARAGYGSRAALLRDLDRRPEGQVYRIHVQPGGADPRITLRESADLSAADAVELEQRLARLDRASKRGPWTDQMLRLLAENPNVRAQDLAEAQGRDKPSFKNDVRKLKTLGLTISHSPGYELSPRGLAYLRLIDHKTVR